MDNEIKEILDLLKYCVEKNEYLEVPNMEEWKPLLDYITNLQQKNVELECDLEELTYSYNELQKELKDKKEQCDNLIEHINPYHYYGLNENDYH
jgi:predicted  nucleic acid-binding Zn-ribbon protein